MAKPKVFLTNPIDRVSYEVLKDVDNAILSTHLAGLSAESLEAMSRIASEETLRILAGDKPLNFCNPEAWERSLARREQLGFRAASPAHVRPACFKQSGTRNQNENN